MWNGGSAAALSCAGFWVSLLPRGSRKPGKGLRGPLGHSPCRKSIYRFSVSSGIRSRDLELHRGIVFLVGMCLFLVLFRPRRVQPILTLLKVILLVSRGTLISLWDNSLEIAVRPACSARGLSRLCCAMAVCVACAGVVLRNLDVVFT